MVKDDPKQKSSSKKGRKGKKGGFFDDITGLWTSFLNSGNKTKLFAIAVVGCILISIFTMDADDLSGPRVKSQDELDYE